ncbi:hypothetical protein HHI36_005278 [Cryptolaemus montrouzieri]|uniref:Uncharacterized protein n=1 Tax=Cryptolaemus montrouzieri TaxID=559131 RepID=A0ABD2NTX4_9CUCU
MQHGDEDISEDADDTDYEDERIENDNYDSVSEQEFEGADVEGDLKLGKNFQIYTGKDNETIWINEPVVHTFQTRLKILSRLFLDPKEPINNVCPSLNVFF